MGSHKDRVAFPLFQLGYEIPNASSRLRVESEGRLVQKEHLRPVKQSPRYLKPSFHAARKILHKVVAPPGKAYHFKYLFNSLFRKAPFHAVKIAVELQVLVRRKLVIEGNFLKHEPYGRPHSVRVLHAIMPVHARPSGGRGKKRAEYVYRGGLSRSVRPYEAERLPFADRKRNTGNSLKPVVTLS